MDCVSEDVSLLRTVLPGKVDVEERLGLLLPKKEPPEVRMVGDKGEAASSREY